VDRARISGICAAVGVLMLLAASIVHDQPYAFIPLLVGLAFIGVSHVLTPCQDQITRWWRARISK
jgi:hypothetical protein